MLPSAKKTHLSPSELPSLQRATLARISSYVAPYKRYGALVFAAVFAVALLNAVPPLLVKQIVDRAIPERRADLLAIACAGMVLGPLLAGTLGVLQKYCAAYIAEKVMFDLRVQLFAHTQQQSMAYFSRSKPGEVLSHVLNDVQGVGQMMQDNLLKLLQNTVILVTTTVIIFALDWRLALGAMALLPVFIFPARRVGHARKALKREAQSRMSELTGILLETLSVSGALLLKIFGTERQELARVERKAAELMEVSLRHNLVGRWFQMAMKLFEEVGPALIYGLGGWLILHGDLRLGTVVAFAALLKKLYSPASDLAGVHVDVVTSYAYFDRIFSVLDLVPEVRTQAGASKLVFTRGALAFRDVSFSYGGQSLSLAGVDLQIAGGECVAVVGPSGAGKTTLAALIPRLYDPTLGSVTLDGHDLRELDVTWLREQIGVVTQDAFLFHASVLENIRYGAAHATRVNVEGAARAAQMHEAIAALPRGYDTIVGERGHTLSGGERQRLALARVILRDPKILILDEATSSLDSSNEVLIQRALLPLLPGRTTLVIAHRLSTVRMANRIVVLDGGRIVESGSHDELLAREGLYARLHAHQLAGHNEASACASP